MHELVAARRAVEGGEVGGEDHGGVPCDLVEQLGHDSDEGCLVVLRGVGRQRDESVGNGGQRLAGRGDVCEKRGVVRVQKRRRAERAAQREGVALAHSEQRGRLQHLADQFAVALVELRSDGLAAHHEWNTAGCGQPPQRRPRVHMAGPDRRHVAPAGHDHRVGLLDSLSDRTAHALR